MKKTTKTLALLLLGVAVGGNSAQAQQRVVAPAGQAYTIQSVAPANGTSVTYQWSRDGAVISGATSDSYTVPANLAKMANGLTADRTFGAIFQRVARSADCMGGVAMSNEVTVYFCELLVNGVCWAKANTDSYTRISANPWDLGYMYQWNKPGNPLAVTGSTVSNFDATRDFATEWTTGVPCPMGWRLPTKSDFQNLISGSNPVGGTWIDNQARGIPAGVAGRLYGYNTQLCTMSDMSGCIFLPAVGYRLNTAGTLGSTTSGLYWSSTPDTYLTSAFLIFSSSSTSINAGDKGSGMSIRCVMDVN